MSEPVVIDPEAMYDDDALCKLLRLRRGSMERARKSGELRYTRRGGRILYVGRWVREWLTMADTQEVATVAKMVAL